MTYHLLSFFIKAVASIPFCVLYIISDVLGFVLYHLIRYRRHIVRRNLTECFPTTSLNEIRRIEKGFYRFFTDVIVESIKMANMSPDTMSRRMKFTNIEQVNDRLRQGRSVSLFLGHYGNWEWISSMPLHLDKSAVAGQIYHKLSNANINRVILEMRSRMGATNIEMHQTARFITKLVAENKECIIGFIADQSPRSKDAHYYLEFLNHDTPILLGPEKITRHYDFDAWFVKPQRVKRGYYEVEFIPMSTAPASLPEYRLSQIYYSNLESMIKDSPELYLWTHKRFRIARCIVQPTNK